MSTPARKTPFVSVSMTPQVRHVLQMAALRLSARARRRVTIGEVARAAYVVSLAHASELAAEIAAPTAELKEIEL